MGNQVVWRTEKRLPWLRQRQWRVWSAVAATLFILGSTFYVSAQPPVKNKPGEGMEFEGHGDLVTFAVFLPGNEHRGVR